MGGQLAILSLLKFFRILRLTKVISYMNASENIKHSLKIFKLLFFLTIYIHFQACAWFYYTKYDKVWFPLEKVLLDQRYLYDENVSIMYQYCSSIYSSVNILLGEEMMPATQYQALILAVALLMGEFIHAHIMGTIAVVLGSMNRKSTKHQEQIEIACQTMKNIQLSQDLQKKVQDYLTTK
jgi:hypothetical protein